MYLLMMVMLSTLVGAASRPADDSAERNAHASAASPFEEDSLSRLQTLIRKESPETALYSEDELKAYFVNSDDSTPRVSDSISKSQRRHGDGESAWEGDHRPGAVDGNASAPASAHRPSPERRSRGLEVPGLESTRRQESGAREAGNSILADEGQNSEDDPTDGQMPKPEAKKTIRISIDAVRIPNKNVRSGLSSHVNDQHDNSLEYRGQWSDRRHNGYYRGRTRPSSPSEESLAILTQKLAKMEVDMGRLKEAVFLQGAVHIKTSERIEMMLLAQGKLAVKNNLDTHKVLKRVRRCCTCAKGAKAERALRRGRKSRNRVKPGEENATTEKPSDSDQNLNNRHSLQNNNAKPSNSQISGRKSDDLHEPERSQSDSHKQRNGSDLQPQGSNIKSENSEESKETDDARSDQSSKSSSILLPQNNGGQHNASVFNSRNLSPQQSTDSSDIAHDDQHNSDLYSSGLTTQTDRSEEVVERQHHDGQNDRLGQTATPSEVLSATAVAPSPDSLRVTPETPKADRTSHPDRPTSTTQKPSTLSALLKEPSTDANNIIHEDVSKNQKNHHGVFTNFTNNLSRTTEVPTASNTTVHKSERSTLSSLQDRGDHRNTQFPLIEEKKDLQNIDPVELEDNIVGKESGERRAQVTEKQPRPKNDSVLDRGATTSQHVSDREEPTTARSAVLTDSLSDNKHADKHNVNTTSAKHFFRQSASDSDRYHAVPQQVRNDTEAPDSSAKYLVNTTAGSEDTQDRYAYSSTPSDTYTHPNEESQSREHSSAQIPPVNVQQPTESVLQIDQKSTDAPMKRENQSSDAPSLLRQDTSISPSSPQKQSENAKSDKSEPLVNVQYSSEVAEAIATTQKQFFVGVQSSEKVRSIDQSENSTAVYHNTAKLPKPASPRPSASTVTPSLSALPTTTTTATSVKHLASSTTLSSTHTTTTTTTTSTSAKLTPTSTTPPTSTKRSNRKRTTLAPSESLSALTQAQDYTTMMTKTQAPASPSSSAAAEVAAKAEAEPPPAVAAAAAETTTTRGMPPTKKASTDAATGMIPRTTLTTSTTTEEEDRELAVDLATGEISNNDLPGVTWIVHPSSSRLSSSGRSLRTRWKRAADAVAPGSPINKPCVMQGVLRFSFTPPTAAKGGGGGGGGGDDGGGGGEGERRRLLLEMTFHRPHRWVFNLGDSIANNGFSGDGTVQENDCEAQGYGMAFAVYASDKHPNGRQKLLKLDNDFIHQKLTLVVTDQSLEWDNHRGRADRLTDASLFALSGQSDSQGAVNYDVYLGLNRVIAGHYRRGHGLCRVSARWLKD